MTAAATTARAGLSSMRWAQRLTQYAKAKGRSIMIGTDMQSSVITLQPARPWHMTESNLAIDHAVSLSEIFADHKRVVFFGVPAPFTGTCTTQHVPGYLHMAPRLGTYVDEIICYSVADPYALYGWSQTLLQKENGKNNTNNDNNDLLSIRFLADPEATFAKAYGVDAVYDDVSLGLRSKRFPCLWKMDEYKCFIK